MGIVYQIPLEVPADVALKLASGNYAITDVVVRNVASGRYARFLPVDTVKRVAEKAVDVAKSSRVSTRSLTQLASSPAGLVGIAVGGAVGEAALVVAKAVADRRKMSKQRRSDAVERANAAMVAYLAAAKAASLDADTIDELAAALDEVKAQQVTGEAINLDLLARLIGDYTAKLAEANGVEAAPDMDEDLAPVVRISDYLARQRGMFGQAG